MDSRVIPSGFGSPVQTGLDNTCPRLIIPNPDPRFDLRRGGGLWGWMGLGEGSLGPRCQVVPQPRATATSPGFSRQITGDSDRGGSEELVGLSQDALSARFLI